jgi:alpha-mannosidase
MYKDVPGAWDAWDIDSTYKSCPVELAEPAQIEIAARGPLWASLRIRRKLHASRLEQEIRLVAGARRLDFITWIDWKESHKLLKVAFPVSVHADEALHEIQFGHIRRPTHRSRPYDADRFEVCCHKWTALVEEGRGAAVLNDSKYGVDVDGGSINLTLLRAPVGPDPTADRGPQTCTYSLLVYEGPFGTSPVVREAYELNVEPPTTGGAAPSTSLFSIDRPNVVIEAVKAAEDGSGDVVVRLYEAMRTATRCTLTAALPVRQVSETNMLEEQPRLLSQDGGRIELAFRPFEIKTLRLRLNAKTVARHS